MFLLLEMTVLKRKMRKECDGARQWRQMYCRTKPLPCGKNEKAAISKREFPGERRAKRGFQDDRVASFLSDLQSNIEQPTS